MVFGREKVQPTQPPDSLFTPAYIDRSSHHQNPTQDARPRSFGSKARRTAKRFVGEPDDAPETVHTLSYLTGSKGNMKQGVKDYLLSLFPFLQWAPRYNVHWLVGDLIA